MSTANISGHWGEALAADYLRSKRYEIIDCNYHSRFGEIDLIAKHRRYILFVEVKASRDDAYAQAREFVTTRKQQRIRASAEIWLEHHPTELQPRFDVIEIYAPEGMDTKRPRIIHLEDAF